MTDITSEQELESIESAISSSSLFKPVKDHLSRALQLYSDREHPDYRNSIKESISSIESLCKIITNNQKGTLGDTLNQLEAEVKLHPALKKHFLTYMDIQTTKVALDIP